MEDVKRIPYGISNFVEVVEQNQYYVCLLYTSDAADDA